MFIWETICRKEDQNVKYTGEKGLIVLNDPVFVRGIRFALKTTERYIGITKLDAFKREFTCMIQPKSNSEYCLAKMDADFGKPKKSLHVMKCAEAAYMGDGREVFVLGLKRDVKLLMDDMCIE